MARRARGRAVRRSSIASVASTFWSTVVRKMVDTRDGDRTLRAWIEAGNDPERCAYCAEPAQTIDHLNCIVRNGMPTGFGHDTHNLVPCCHPCNSSKGTRPWRLWMLARSGKSSPAYQTLDRFERTHNRRDVFEFEDARAMLLHLREHCYAYCRIYDEVVDACTSDPSHWREHVSRLPPMALSVKDLTV